MSRRIRRSNSSCARLVAGWWFAFAICVVTFTFSGCQELDLSGSDLISNATLQRLKGFKNLKQLRASDTSCTLEGIQALAKLLPDCEISFGGSVY